MTIQELLQKRAKLINQARTILDTAEAEERALTQEEQNKYDQLLDDASDLQATVDRRQMQRRIEESLAESAGRQTSDGQPGDNDGDDQPAPRYEFRSRSLEALNREGIPAGFEERISPAYRQAFRYWMADGAQIAPEHVRALQADNETLGGNLYAPLQLVDRILQAVDNAVYMRQWATVIPVTDGESLGVPTLDTDPADPAWTSEIGAVSEDSSMAFGRRELSPNLLTKLVKISRKLLRKAPNAEDLVVQRLAYKFGVAFESNLLTGNGAKQPLGVFTASSDGISTGRDVSTGNTTTSIQFDGLIEAKYTLKSQYWPMARWLFHRDGMKQIAKLKDGDGQYIWRESTRASEPDRVLGLPARMSEYAPNTFTSGNYVGILGDFSYVWIADSLALEFQRLMELYAGNNQVGLIGRLESDGMPVLEEAFVRVKLA